MKTVIIPVIMNDRVANIERIENLEIPQIPWPLVQPEANVVPNPTSNPATIIKILLFSIFTSIGPTTIAYIIGLNKRPNKNKIELNL